MANNTIQGGTSTMATDEIATVHHQYVKVEFGGEDVATPVSKADPLPIVEWDPEIGLSGGVTTYRQRMTAMSYTVLADSIADGLAAFWSSSVANGGTTTSSGGEGLIQTSANALGSAQLVSTAPPYFPGQSAWCMAAARFGDTGSVGNIRRIGAFTVSGTTPQDGFCFELNGTTFNIVIFKAGVATTVASTTLSNVLVAPFTVDLNYHLWEIRWASNGADFYIDGVLRHRASGGSTSLTGTLNFPMAAQNINTSGATNRILAVRNIGLGRHGTPPTDPHQGAYYRGRASTYRMVGRAGTVPRRALALWNAVGSGRTVEIGQISIDVLATAAVAVTVVSPIFRIHRITAIPTNGSALTKTPKSTGDISSASITLFQDASADGTNSATALAATVTAGSHLTQEFCPRLITGAGYEMSDRVELLTDQQILVRPGEGIVLSYDGITAATQEPASLHSIATIDWRETA